MGQHYSQLTEAERNQIYVLRKAGLAVAKIAKFIGRPRCTVYRELQRNTGQRGYPKFNSSAPRLLPFGD